MYRFLALLLTCIYMCNVFAHPNIISMPRTVEEQIQQQEERDPETDSQTAKYLSMDPHWQHTIASVKKHGNLIELEDGSQWDVPWYWRGTADKWSKGDMIIVKWDPDAKYVHLKLRNVTQGSHVWTNLYNYPDPNSSNLHVIQSVQNHDSTVVLEDGLIVHSNLGFFAGWKAGDVVGTLTRLNTKKCYALWNFSGQYVAWNLTLESGT